MAACTFDVRLFELIIGLETPAEAHENEVSSTGSEDVKRGASVGQE